MRTRLLPLVAAVAAALAVVAQPASATRAAVSPGATARHQVTYDHYSVSIDGRRVLLRSAEFHYFRLPSPDLWADVLEKYKAAGFNTVSIYFDWAYHSPKAGVYDFAGVRDVDRLLRTAERAGPYVTRTTRGWAHAANCPGRAT